MKESPHSEFILSDNRDCWWNEDFLDLMAERLRLEDVHRILDVGSGHGHWGHLWARYFAPDYSVFGIDPEERWVTEAARRSERLGLQDRFSYQLGTAEKLPVADSSFDFVTCQTLLMHVKDADRAVAEMKRVLVPGGLLLLSEANNFVSILLFDSLQRQKSVQETLQMVRFHLLCNEGRRQLGEGDYSICSRLPEMLADQDFADVTVYLNDHASPTIPGHTGEDQMRQLREKARNIKAGAWLWNVSEAKRLYAAGGGEHDVFDSDYKVFMAEADAFITNVEQGTYSGAGGAVHYLISARRKSPRGLRNESSILDNS